MQGSDARRPSTDAPATIGPYRLLAPLGRGGMGVVYRAEHVETGAPVALKTVGISDPNLLSSIRREIHALRQVEHPGVVRIVGEGVEGGLPWYAMELLQGRTLRDHNSERWRSHVTMEALPTGAVNAFADAVTDIVPTGADRPDPEAQAFTAGERTGEVHGPTRGSNPAPPGSPLPLARPGATPSKPVSPNPTPPTRILPPNRPHTPMSPSRPGAPGALPMPLRTFREAGAGELPRALSLFRTICRPLSYIHGLGLVHRDLKPENVFIREDGSPVLVDFGLAVQLDAAKGRGELELQFGGKPMGSPSYMAPEQIRGDLVDARADLYALGCMLYEAVTGSVPFVGASSAVILSMHMFTAPIPPSTLVEGVPPGLDLLILRLLQKRPEDRIGYAEDVAATLAELGAADLDEGAAPAWKRAQRPQPYLYRPGLAGRGDALRQLFGLLARLQEGKGGAAWLAGESGIGKTRLVMEVATEAARLAMTVVTGECVAVSVGDGGEGRERGGVKAAPLHPLRHLLLAVADRIRSAGAGGADGSSEQAADRRSPDEVYDALLGPRGRLLAAYEPALAQLPGQERYPEPPPLPAEAARFRLRSAVAETIAALAGEGPLVLVLDDLQWADDSTLGALELLDASFFEENRVVVLGTYRSEEATPAVESLARAPGSLRLEIGRLDVKAVGRMVSDMLAMERPPEALTAFLLDQSEGNPFFIAEYLRAAVQEGLLYRDHLGSFRIKSAAVPPPPASSAQHAPSARAPASAPPSTEWSALALPGSLKELVARRLGGLSAGARKLARVASVLGREMEEFVLVSAAAAGEVEAMEALAELNRRHVLEQAEAGSLRFVHDKLREISYAEIPEEEVVRLHGAVAHALEARHAGSPDLPLAYPQLAHHFARAGAADKALSYLELAGEQALAGGASGEARELFQRALSLDEAQPPAARAARVRRARWERRLGQACYNLGDLRAAEQGCVNALALLDRPAAQVFQAREAPLSARTAKNAAWQLGRQLLHLGGVRIQPAATEAERERLAEASLAAELLSETYLFQNQANLAFVAALEATNAAAGLGPSAALARGYATLSVAFGYVPWPAVVGAYARRAEQTATESEDPQAEAFVAFMRGLTALGEGRCRDARALLTRAEQAAERVGNRRRQEECIALIGTAAHFEGLWAEALARFAVLQASARRSSNAQGLVWAQSGRAQTLIMLGDGQEAAELLEELLHSAEQSGDRAQQITLGQVAQAHLLRGDRGAARRSAERTLTLLREQGKPAAFHALHGYVAVCEVLLDELEGGPPPARREALVREIGEACRALRGYAQIFPLGRPDALRLAGVADWLTGRERRARRRWDKAADEAARLGLSVHEGLSRYELRRLPRSDADRRWNLLRAEEIFARLGIPYWREQVERARVG